MLSKKEVRKIIINEYLNILLDMLDDANQLTKFKKGNLASYPDEYNDYRYMTDFLDINDKKVKFHIKRNIFRVALYVEISKDDACDETIKLYNNLFYHKKDSITDKIKNAVSYIDIQEVLDISNDKKTILRKIKLNKIKR